MLASQGTVILIVTTDVEDNTLPLIYSNPVRSFRSKPTRHTVLRKEAFSVYRDGVTKDGRNNTQISTPV
ncbi:hypothetical protein BaRGS_00003470 [Batillaria attramentaria]|uniref:Uncharacterized protein n=1 Tax=Batillaria attramentaria TaxID=370345 RepID=A0ABD0M1X6_9CAEN